MSKKPILPEDVKIEDIDRVIDKTLYGVDESKSRAILKLFTFLLLFVLYIYLSIKVEDYMTKLIIIIFGIVILVFLFQEIVFPAFKGKKRKSLLEP